MAFDMGSVLTHIVALVGTATGIQSVTEGVPAQMANTVEAYVALGAQTPIDKSNGLLQRDADVLVVLGYRTKGTQVGPAEQQIAQSVDNLFTHWAADRKMGGLATNSVMDLTPAGRPEYAVFAGMEYRLYPLIFRVTQQQTFNNQQ